MVPGPVHGFLIVVVNLYLHKVKYSKYGKSMARILEGGLNIFLD